MRLRNFTRFVFIWYKDFFKVRDMNFNKNKTGTRQYTRAVWSTFAQIHSNHSGALMHYLG